jgi:catechol 2,3-dioxygenase-like lactoylglutathione lyase family enzyme
MSETTPKSIADAPNRIRPYMVDGVRNEARPALSGAQLLGINPYTMSVKVYGCNHIAIEVDDVDKAVAFYQDVFDLEKLDDGEGDAFLRLGEHQFLAIFKVDRVERARLRHFGIMVRDEAQIAEVRDKLVNQYGIELIPPFRCDFHDPFGNRIQVVDLHDESLIWLLPDREVQDTRIAFREPEALHRS